MPQKADAGDGYLYGRKDRWWAGGALHPLPLCYNHVRRVLPGHARPLIPETVLLAVQGVTNPTGLRQFTVAAVRATDVVAFDDALQEVLAQP